MNIDSLIFKILYQYAWRAGYLLFDWRISGIAPIAMKGELAFRSQDGATLTNHSMQKEVLIANIMDHGPGSRDRAYYT